MPLSVETGKILIEYSHVALQQQLMFTDLRMEAEQRDKAQQQSSCCHVESRLSLIIAGGSREKDREEQD